MSIDTKTRQFEEDTIADEDAFADALVEGLQAGATLKDLRGLDDHTMEGVYAYAHRFYTNGQLDEAETFFRFLCLYDFYNGEYALGLGAVYQMKKQYQKAIDLYALAFALTKDDYRPMMYVGQCHLAMKKIDLAMGCFQVVVDKSKDAKLVERAIAYQEAMASSSEDATSGEGQA